MQTKIVCTIGPASKTKTTLKQMMQAGMNVCRINFSHGSHESNGELLKNIRQTSLELGKNIGILTDLQGPRIRVLSVTDPVEIKKRQIVFLYEGKDIKEKKEADLCLGIDSKNLIKYLTKGDQVFIDNGMMELVVLKKSIKGVYCKVLMPGIIKSRKGLNIPKLSSKMNAFTKSDQINLEYMLSQNIDFIAMSFVRNKNDIIKLRKKIKDILKTKDPMNLPNIIAKIETSEAVPHFEEILEEADGIMIARGDLAIEQPMEKIPILQKTMINKCMLAAKPVIVATQMLESMMENPRPTRAEITDVANAVIDHTDAVMLSGESAMGKFPAETVQTMTKIINYTEKGPQNDLDLNEFKTKSDKKYTFFAKSAILLAEKMETKNMVIRDCPFQVAVRVSQLRPEKNIFFLTKDKRESRKLALAWGVYTKDSLNDISGSYVLLDKVYKGSGSIIFNDNTCG